MYHRFRWTNVSVRRNAITAEYEPFQPYFLLAVAAKAECRTFVDVGANIGAYSVLASQLPSLRRIVAFEANRSAAKELQVNFSLNDIDADVREAAVSDKAGKVEFGVVSKFAGNNAVLETSIHERSLFHETVTVDAVTLDDELSDPEGPICLKVDVEGHEPAVLRGAREVLRRARCVIQIENYRGEVAPVLEELGYSQITKIGPDYYFSNIASLIEPAVVISLYEAACRAQIEANHENKLVTLRRGDFGLQISGKSYDRAKRLAQKFLGHRL
jgi:FkbM family methyltransferase